MECIYCWPISQCKANFFSNALFPVEIVDVPDFIFYQFVQNVPHVDVDDD